MPIDQSLYNKLVVRINKELQNKKREKIGNFYVPEHMMDFTNNLQFGEVVAFGPEVLKYIPDIAIGDVAIFDHQIEFKVLSTNKRDDEAAINEVDKFLIEVEDSLDELRYVPCSSEHANKLFGIYKNGEIIPSKGMLFCSIEAKITDYQLVNGIYINSKESKQHIIDALEVANFARKEYSEANAKIPYTTLHAELHEELNSHISRIDKEIYSLTQRLNRVELAEVTVLFNNKLDSDEIEKGDVLLIDEKLIYPLDLFGSRFILIRNIEWIVAKILNSNTMSKKGLGIMPLSNRVIIKTDDLKSKTEKGILIPDTAKERSCVGRVVAVGKGYSTEFPMELKPGDRVLIEKFKGIEIMLDNEMHLAVKDIDVICKLSDHISAGIGTLES